jgi:hypothetical protein
MKSLRYALKAWVQFIPIHILFLLVGYTSYNNSLDTGNMEKLDLIFGRLLWLPFVSIIYSIPMKWIFDKANRENDGSK